MEQRTPVNDSEQVERSSLGQTPVADLLGSRETTDVGPALDWYQAKQNSGLERPDDR